MQYPLISEYIEAIHSAEYNFDRLKNLRPVLDDAGIPIMSSRQLCRGIQNDGREQLLCT